MTLKDNNNGWTPERRRKQAEAIKKWKPWEQSTGPKTVEGKESIKENALKHGLYSEDGMKLRRLMHHQRILVNAIIRSDKNNDI